MSKSKKEEEVATLEAPKEEAKPTAGVINTKRFVIRKKLVGQGATIRFTNSKGQTWLYDHDKVYLANQEKLEGMPCFQKYKTYTSTNSIPTFAKEFALQEEEAEA